MNIKECIDIVDNVKPNQYSIEQKVDWLSYLDHSIINEVLLTHEGYDGRYDDFTGYSPDRLSDGLIVPSPYDRLYPAYIKMKIDEENGETARYNNSVVMFNAYYTEYKRWYHSKHLPLSPSDRRTLPQPAQSDVSEAQLEQLINIVYAKLQDDVLKAISNDKIYAIVKSYMDTNAQMLKGKDGLDGANGKDGKNGMDGKDGMSAYQYAIRGGFKGTEAEFYKAFANLQSQSRIGEVKLLASAWVKEEEDKYSQVVDIEGVTENSQVDLTPTDAQLVIFREKDLAFTTKNKNRVVTVYVIGQKPMNDYTIQVTITEVNV